MAVGAACLTLAGVFAAIFFNTSIKVISMLIGTCILGGGIFAMAGTYFSIIALKEPTTPRKVAATTVNFGLTLFIIAVLIANMVDIFKLLI